MMIYGLSMNKINLCTKLKINHIINNSPESFELLICISDSLNKDYGWYISPYNFKQKVQNTLKNAEKQMFLSKNHSKLIQQLQNSLKPHTIQRVEINNIEQKLVYEI